jgi:LmbE family N-acetylglucosaminyl deacetylase
VGYHRLCRCRHQSRISDVHGWGLGSVTNFVRAIVRRLRPGWVRRLVSIAGIDVLAPPSVIDLPEGRRLMVLAPHPDDESIGCGGLIAKWIEDGRSASIVFLSDGSRGAKAEVDKASAGEALASLRRREALEAIQRLGGAEAVFLGLQDGALSANEVPLSEHLRKQVSGWHPDVIALPYVTDRHPDHTAVAPALLRALDGLDPRTRPTTFLCYEIWSPLQAVIVVDVTAQADRKVAAINAHSSQTEQRNYAESALGLNRYRACSGLIAGRYAEAFWMGSLAELANLRSQVRV